MIRFAVSGRVIDRDEKARHEVATMQFIKTETKILSLCLSLGHVQR